MQRHKKASVSVLVMSFCVLVFLGSLEECSQEEGRLTKNRMKLPCLDSMEIWTPRSWLGETDKRYFSISKSSVLMVCRIDSSECTSCKIRSLYKLSLLAESLSKEMQSRVRPFVYVVMDTRKKRICQRSYYDSILSVPVIVDCDDALRKKNPWMRQSKKTNVYVIDGEGNILKALGW